MAMALALQANEEREDVVNNLVREMGPYVQSDVGWGEFAEIEHPELGLVSLHLASYHLLDSLFEEREVVLKMYTNWREVNERIVANLKLSRFDRPTKPAPYWNVIHRAVRRGCERNGLGSLAMDIFERIAAVTDLKTVGLDVAASDETNQDTGVLHRKAVQVSSFGLFEGRGYFPRDEESFRLAGDVRNRVGFVFADNQSGRETAFGADPYDKFKLELVKNCGHLNRAGEDSDCG
ncbi:hypothetical protein HOE67_05390 [Candidatus Peregrinibacteria bacterium]|jgi:hypothetical protein|nr:hypothetical protein [Candidatus Peregrinibacteria bacterium]MBT4056516.1 hypothetical protein [Candidatus Peregrinibacteria bacterium]